MEDHHSTDRRCVLVKRVPQELGEETLKQLLEHYGGEIESLRIWKARCCLFVTYKRAEDALRALTRLQNLKLLNKKLTAEWAKEPHEKDFEKRLQESKERERLRALGTYRAPDPIAESLGIDYGPPPELEYQYPKANPQILQNIYNAIASNERLYIQVLHLMNKMNLPTPFGSELPVPPHLSMQSGKKRKDRLLASDESELESEEEQPPPRKPFLISHLTKRDRQLLPIELQIPDELALPSIVPRESAHAAALTHIAVQVDVETKEMEVADQDKPLVLPVKPTRNVISTKELEANRKTIQEIEELPLFKDKDKKYDPGVPNRKLFAKNLPKNVKRSQLEYIFGRYFDTDEEMKRDLEIQIMGGRMKGQAFITFPSVELAQRALAECHGYILNEKPMILEFGRSTKGPKQLEQDNG